MARVSDKSIAVSGQAAATGEGIGCGRLALIVAGIAVVAVLAVFGVRVAGNAGAGGGTPGAPGILTIGQEAAGQIRPAPDFQVTLFSGEARTLADLRGRPVVVNFWATWCPPCREEAPVFERVWRDYQGRGVEFIGLDIWDTEVEAKKFLERFSLTYPNAPDPRGKVAVEYGVSGIPETFFVDRQGRIVRRWNGPLTDDKLRAFVEEILASSPVTGA